MLTEPDVALVGRVRRFKRYLCEPGALDALRFLYGHRVVSRTEWLLAVWAVGSELRRVEPPMSDEDVIALMKQVFDAEETPTDAAPSPDPAPPCRHPSHVGHSWSGDSGRMICGV